MLPFFQQIALNNVANETYIYKFGRNPAVGATEAIISEGGIYGLPPTAKVVSVVSDDVANDNPTGSGARTIKISGLDANYNRVEEIVNVGATSTVEFLRVFRATVQTAGTIIPIAGGNSGTITISQSTPTVNMVKIAPNDSQTLVSCYTVPAGFTALMWQADITTGEGKNATARLKSREFNTDQPFRTKGIRDSFENTAGQAFAIPTVYPEKTDIVFTAISTAAGTPISGTFLLELVKNEDII